MSKNRSRKNKGGACGMNKQEGGKDKKDNMAAQAGGNKDKKKGGKTRRVSKGASEWNKKVMEVYRELKKKNPATKLGDAMRECSKRKKRGDL